MKIVQINTFPYKSTGNIMLSIQRKLLAENVECYSIWGRGRKSENKYEIFMNDKNGVRFMDFTLGCWIKQDLHQYEQQKN